MNTERHAVRAHCAVLLLHCPVKVALGKQDQSVGCNGSKVIFFGVKPVGKAVTEFVSVAQQRVNEALRWYVAPIVRGARTLQPCFKHPRNGAQSYTGHKCQAWLLLI